MSFVISSFTWSKHLSTQQWYKRVKEYKFELAWVNFTSPFDLFFQGIQENLTFPPLPPPKKKTTLYLGFYVFLIVLTIFMISRSMKFDQKISSSFDRNQIFHSVLKVQSCKSETLRKFLLRIKSQLFVHLFVCLFFISGFSYTNIPDSQDSRGRWSVSI